MLASFAKSHASLSPVTAKTRIINFPVLVRCHFKPGTFFQIAPNRSRGHGQLQSPLVRYPRKQSVRQGHVRGRLPYRPWPQHCPVHRKSG